MTAKVVPYSSSNEQQILQSQLQVAELLFELILIRDGSFYLPNNLTRDEIEQIIIFLCMS
jgi:hypothetical protein